MKIKPIVALISIPLVLLLAGCSTSGPSEATKAACERAVTTADEMVESISNLKQTPKDSALKNKIENLAAKIRSLGKSIDDPDLSAEVTKFGQAYLTWMKLARAGKPNQANEALKATDGTSWYEYCNTLR